MKDLVRFAVVGTGSVARSFARSLPYGNRMVVSAVVSRDLSRATALAAAHAPSARAYSSLDEMLTDRAVDIVYVATPNDLHAAQSIQSLEAGKPVLVEKPFATNAADAGRIVATARRTGLFCMEAMWMRCLPLVQRAKQLIAEGAIGDVRTVSADFSVPTDLSDPTSAYLDARRGGGALLDRGVYCVSLAYYLLGEPRRVESVAELGETGVDLHSELLMSFDSGASALLSSSLTTHGTSTAFVAGTTGSLQLHAPFFRPERITVTSQGMAKSAGELRAATLRERAQESALVRHALGRLRPLLRRPRLDLHLPILGPGYHFEADEAARCLREGVAESSLIPLDESVRIVATMDQARARWKESRTRAST